MVRLRAEAAIGPCGLKKEMERRQAMHQKRLDLYKRLEQKDFFGKPPSRERRLQHLVLKAGIPHEKLWLEVSREALAILALPE